MSAFFLVRDVRRGELAALAFACLLLAFAGLEPRDPAQRVPQNRTVASSTSPAIGTGAPPVHKDRVRIKAPACPDARFTLPGRQNTIHPMAPAAAPPRPYLQIARSRTSRAPPALPV